MGASFLFATPFGIADMKGERDKQQLANRFGLEARMDDIRDITQGDFNGDGNQDYQVIYTDGTVQLYLHQGYAGPVAPDSAETYLKQAPK